MPAALAYATLDEILAAIERRLRDELGGTQKTVFFTLDPDSKGAGLSGQTWFTVEAGPITFSPRHANAAGRKMFRCETTALVRISTMLSLDDIGRAKMLMLQPGQNLPYELGRVLAALSGDEDDPDNLWNPARDNGELMTVDGLTPLEANFGPSPANKDIAICEIPFRFAFDWDFR